MIKLRLCDDCDDFVSDCARLFREACKKSLPELAKSSGKTARADFFCDEKPSVTVKVTLGEEVLLEKNFVV